MEELKKDQILAFDSYYTEPHIQMLKVLFPYVPPSYQKYVAMYIKFSELEIVMKKSTNDLGLSSFTGNNYSPPNPSILCQELLPFCSASEKSMVENMLNLLHTFDSYKDMLEMINMMKDFMPEGMDMGNLNGDTLSQMMGMFSGMNNKV